MVCQAAKELIVHSWWWHLWNDPMRDNMWSLSAAIGAGVILSLVALTPLLREWGQRKRRGGGWWRGGGVDVRRGGGDRPPPVCHREMAAPRCAGHRRRNQAHAGRAVPDPNLPYAYTMTTVHTRRHGRILVVAACGGSPPFAAVVRAI